LTGPVRLVIYATFEPAQSWSKKKRAEHLHRPHTHKPDLDKLAKAVADGLNRVAWGDDSQVAEMVVRKVWGITPQTVVQVEALG
jgi:Holliday junction resolvase RusA-like endonuclease